MSKLDDALESAAKFNQARGWDAVPQDLAKSVVIESAELLELFQWDSSDRNLGSNPKPKDIDKVKSEIADVLWYLSSLCRSMNIDLADALFSKIKYQEEKYPAEMFNGKHNDEFYKQRKAEYRQNRK